MLFEEYLQRIPSLHSWAAAGCFESWQLEKLYKFLRSELPEGSVFLETGAGNSTIGLLFLKPRKLISIESDANVFERIHLFCRANDIPDAALEENLDDSQWVLPRLAAANRASDPFLDFALLDGCHGWPTAFVDVEYINFMLRQGGYLMIDDVQLYSEKEIARLISEHPAYSLVLDLGKSLVFRKVTDDRHLGEWVDQPYIVRRTNEYSRLPNPFALRDPGLTSRAVHRAKSFLLRIRQR